MKVRIEEPGKVRWCGRRHAKGDELEVPAQVGQTWVKNGWAKEVVPAHKKVVKKAVTPAAKGEKR